MIKPTLDQLRTLVTTISAGREVNVEKLAQMLFSVPMQEMTFEEFPVDSGEIDALTLEEMQVLMECGNALVDQLRRELPRLMRGKQN